MLQELQSLWPKKVGRLSILQLNAYIIYIQYLPGCRDLGSHHTSIRGVFEETSTLCIAALNPKQTFVLECHLTHHQIYGGLQFCWVFLRISMYHHSWVSPHVCAVATIHTLMAYSSSHLPALKGTRTAMARAGLLPHEKKLLETKDLVEAIGYDPIYSLSVGKCFCKSSLKIEIFYALRCRLKAGSATQQCHSGITQRRQCHPTWSTYFGFPGSQAGYPRTSPLSVVWLFRFFGAWICLTKLVDIKAGPWSEFYYTVYLPV